eukprot:364537-Chlamydomonas_euryale.AAC.4
MPPPQLECAPAPASSASPNLAAPAALGRRRRPPATAVVCNRQRARSSLMSGQSHDGAVS